MEDIKAELKLGEVKMESLRKSLEQASAQASSVLLFTLQWKELESRFDLIRQNIEKRVAVVESQEKELENAARVLKERQEEIGLKENELSLLNKKIEECNAELKLKQEEHNLMQKLLEECLLDLDLARKSVEDCSKELSLKKEQLCYVEKLISERCEKLEGKEKQLGLAEERIQESNKEIDVQKKKLDSLQSLVEECEAKLESKERELGLVLIRVDECFNEMKKVGLDLKENMLKQDESLAMKEELECLRNSIKECSNQLDMKRNELVRSQEKMEDQCTQLNENEKKLDSIKTLIQDYEEELEARKEKYEALDKSVRVHAAELDFKEKKLGLIEETIMDRSQELHSRDDELDSLEKLIKRSEKKLESTRKELDSVKSKVERYSEDLELKKQELNAIQMCTEERRQELDSKEKQLSLVQISIKGCSKRLEAEEEKLTSIKNSILECSKELQSKQQQLEAMQKSQEQLSVVLESKEKQLGLVEKAYSERLEKLETEKRQFEARVKEFEVKEKQFDSVQKVVEQRRKELDLKEKQLTNALHSQERSENPISYLRRAFGITNTEKVNPIIPNQIKTEQPEHFIISNANETSSANIGVGAKMDGMNLQGIPNEFLEQPDLRKNEVLRALQVSRDPATFVLDVIQGITSERKKKGGTGFEEGILKIYLLMLEQLLLVSPLVQTKVKADALMLAKEWKAKMEANAENYIGTSCFLLFVAAFELMCFFDRDEIFKLIRITTPYQQARTVYRALARMDMIPEFVRNLIARKQYIEAIRFVCAFDCKDKCPPQHLLELFLEDLKREACNGYKANKNLPEFQKATDEQIAALKSAIECIKDYKLESCMSLGVLEKCIVELEKLKMNKTFSAPAPAPLVQSNVTTCNAGPSALRYQPGRVPAVQGQFQGGIYAPGNQAQQQFQGGIYASPLGTKLQGLSNKRARTNGPVINSYTPPVPSVNKPNIRSAPQHGFGVPSNRGVAHFGLAANFGHSSTSATGQPNVAEKKYPIHNRPKQL